MTAHDILKDRTELVVEPLNEALEKLTNSTDMDILGHGTVSKETAENIFKTGLKATNHDLYRTAVPLLTTDQDPDASKRNEELIKAWPHRDAKYVVILGVTHPSEEDNPGYKYLQSIVQPDPEETGGNYYQETGVIPNRFVAGYFDTTSDTFVHNTGFDPHYDPKLYQTTVDGEIRRILDWVDPTSIPIGSTAVKHSTPEIIDPNTWDNDAPDVW